MMGAVAILQEQEVTHWANAFMLEVELCATFGDQNALAIVHDVQLNSNVSGQHWGERLGAMLTRMGDGKSTQSTTLTACCIVR